MQPFRRYRCVKGNFLRYAAFCMALTAILTATGAVERLRADDARGKSSAPKLERLHLSDYRGRVWELNEFEKSPVVVVAFLGVECPLAKLYSQRLVELHKEFSDRSVAFIGIDANAQDSLSEIAAHARRFSIEFPVLYDGAHEVVKQLNATRTPEVFVLDSARRVCYQGRIDDQFGIGYQKKKAEQEPLKDAIKELLSGKDVTVTNVPAVGCLIGKSHSETRKANSDVTYSKHVAPIFRDACVQCHRAGEIGPFPMTSYEEVAPWAEMIAEVVAEKRMPPWHADPAYSQFANDCSLSGEQLSTVAKWVAAGAPEGDPADLPEPRKYVDGWQLPREPDLVLNVSSEPYNVPATGEVRYQYFRVDPKFTEEKWVKVAQILPGNRAVVHHILVFVRSKGARGPLDGERGFLFGYVPGSLAQPYPDGAAKRIPADSELIFQVHYTPIGTPQTDHSKIGLVFADPSEVKREVLTTSAVQLRLNIPPKEGNYKVDAMLPEDLPECELLGMAPHMHLRGKSFRYTSVAPDKTRQIILDVPKYDFNWQTAYRLKEPMKLPAKTRIYCEAVFDNSEKNLNNPNPAAWVRWGDQTTDEMMIGYFDIMIDRDKSEGKVSLAGGDRVRAQRLELIRLILRDRLVERLDTNKDNKIELSEVPQRWKNQFELLDANRDGVLSSDELQDTQQK